MNRNTHTDIYLDSVKRTNIVKNSGAKYCISNHINAFNSTASGAETIHSIYSDGKLATALLDAIVSEGMPKRRVFSKEGKNGDYYYMHRMTGSVSTQIIEYGFATNVEDSNLIIENWKRYAEAVVKAFCEFIGHPYKPIQTNRFSDVPEDHWANDVINKAADKGIINGYPNGTFKPDQNVTRAELAVVIDRLSN